MNVIQIYDIKRRSDPFADHRRFRNPNLQHLSVGTEYVCMYTAAALQMSPTEFVIAKCLGSNIHMGITGKSEYNDGGGNTVIYLL